MSLVHLLFLKYSSLNRHPPSLLGGFHGANYPPFNQYYEDAKTAFALLLAFSSPRLRYQFDTAFSLRLDKVAICALSARIVWVRSILGNRFFRLEAVGSPVFPYYPCLPLICS